MLRPMARRLKRLRSVLPADALFAHAQKLEAEAANPRAKDDPRWLKRQAGKASQIGRKKEKAAVHKREQR